jgi:hypothetical protein
MFQRFVFGATLSLFAVACSAPARPQPSGSSTLALSSDGKALYAVSVDDDALATMDLEHDAVDRVKLGSAPTRVARAKDRVFVSLRGERMVAVLKEHPGQYPALVAETKLDTGAEPYGLVASPNEERLYIASSMSNEIEEVDVATLGVLRRFSAGVEPRWLAIDPSGRSLYVGSARGSRWTWIDLEHGAIHDLELPQVLIDPSMASSLAARVTGDPAVSADGRMLIWPSLYVDNLTPLAETSSIGMPVTVTNLDPFGSGSYSSRATPAIVVVPLEDAGAPLVERSYVARTDEALFAGPPQHQATTRGMLAAVVVAPDSKTVVGLAEGTRAVVLLQIVGQARIAEPVSASSAALTGGSTLAFSGTSSPSGTLGTSVAGLPNPGSFGPPIGTTVPNPSFVPTAIEADDGPRGALFLDRSTVAVHSWLSRSVSRLGLGDSPFETSGAGLVGGLSDTNSLTLPHAVPGFGRRIEITPPVLAEVVERGRLLFYSADDGLASGVGTGIACATCHEDGRRDGLVFSFALRGLRRTLSIAGAIRQTAPMGWQGDFGTLEEDVISTSRVRMGSSGLSFEDAQAIASFLDQSPDIDVPGRGSSDPAVGRGQAIFERADVGCGGCHHGPRLTDNRTYAMFGLPQVKTRSLVSVSAGGPYLHDGSAKTLEDVLERAEAGGMGHTAQLTQAEKDDLLAYLRSL